MKKTLFLLFVASLLIVTFSSAAIAFDGGNSAASYEDCAKEMLDSEDRTKFENIINDFRENMSELRDLMLSLRIEGEYEEFREKHAERLELMEEKVDALNDILPEDIANRFQAKGRELRHNGWDKNSGGFKAQSNSNR